MPKKLSIKEEKHNILGSCDKNIQNIGKIEKFAKNTKEIFAKNIIKTQEFDLQINEKSVNITMYRYR